MDYKTNILKNEVKNFSEVLHEASGLLFGEVSDERPVFDYTAYFENNNLDFIDHKMFMRANRMYIETLAKSRGRNTSELFYQNTNGHILVGVELTFLFLAFANPEMLIYFNSLISDVVGTGAAYSDSFIYSAASERLPSEALLEIIQKRDFDEEGDQQQPDSDSCL